MGIKQIWADFFASKKESTVDHRKELALHEAAAAKHRAQIAIEESKEFFENLNDNMQRLAQLNADIKAAAGNESAVQVDTIAIALTDIHGKPVSGTDIHGNPLTVPSQEAVAAALGGDNADGVYYKLTTAERYFKETKNSDGSVERVEVSEAEFKKGQAAEQAYKTEQEAKAAAKPPGGVEVPNYPVLIEDSLKKLRFISRLKVLFDAATDKDKEDIEKNTARLIDALTSTIDSDNVELMTSFEKRVVSNSSLGDDEKAIIAEIIRLKREELEAKAAAAAPPAPVVEAKASDYDPNVTYGVVKDAPVLLVSTTPFADEETAGTSQSLEQIGSRLGGKKVRQVSVEDIFATKIGDLDLSGVKLEPTEPKKKSWFSFGRNSKG